MSNYLFLPNLFFFIKKGGNFKIFLLKSSNKLTKYDLKLFIYDVYMSLSINSIHSVVIRNAVVKKDIVFGKHNKYF